MEDKKKEEKRVEDRKKEGRKGKKERKEGRKDGKEGRKGRMRRFLVWDEKIRDQGYGMKQENEKTGDH
jgi:hypothetical protein